jgi:hypothetical protein
VSSHDHATEMRRSTITETAAEKPGIDVIRLDIDSSIPATAARPAAGNSAAGAKPIGMFGRKARSPLNELPIISANLTRRGREACLPLTRFVL